MISIILPANNEEAYIGACLSDILASDDPGGLVQVIVAANGCTDATVRRAQELEERFEARNWRLDIIEIARGSKFEALNAGDAAALHGKRLYLDADIRLSPELLVQVSKAIGFAAPVYASGTLRVPRARSWVSDRYAGFWTCLPFVADGVPGCGLFAVNESGRARWGDFPPVISDDTFVRLHFSDEEMHKVPAIYDWPVSEGFANLVRVRRRQNEGLGEIHDLYPDLSAQMTPTKPSFRRMIRLWGRDPIGFAVYAAVAVAVRLPFFRNRGRWDRGR